MNLRYRFILFEFLGKGLIIWWLMEEKTRKIDIFVVFLFKYMGNQTSIFSLCFHWLMEFLTVSKETSSCVVWPEAASLAALIGLKHYCFCASPENSSQLE